MITVATDEMLDGADSNARRVGSVRPSRNQG